jgi:HD-like signal output (HDOD) protein
MTMQAEAIDRELSLARTEGPVRTLMIPPCPELLTQLQAQMRHDDPDWNEVAAIANADVAMAAALVRAANSPLYARRSPVQSVEQAMSLLGLRACAVLLTQFLTARALPLKHPALEHFWERSSRRALAMAYVARHLYGTPPDLAQTLGLFCDVGVPLLLQGLPGYAGTLAEGHARRDRRITATEQAAHKTDHAIVGALVARVWGLPPQIKIAIRLHHEPEAVAEAGLESEVRTLVACAQLADTLVQRFDHKPDPVEWEQHGAGCLAHLQVSLQEMTDWQDALHDSFVYLQ